jgi:hypothetical protein
MDRWRGYIMKRYFQALALMACILIMGPVARALPPFVVGSAPTAGPSPDYCVDWDSPCDDTLCTTEGSGCGSDYWESESDASGYINLTSSQLTYSNENETDSSTWIVESSSIDDVQEATIWFQISWDDVTDIVNGIDDYAFFRSHDNAGSDWVCYAEFTSDANGDIYSYTITEDLANAGTVATMSGVAASTQYWVYIYWKRHATTGGCSMKVGSWDAATTGFDDDTTDPAAGLGVIYLGGPNNDWGDGTTDATTTFDNFEIYLSDQRSYPGRP